MLVSLTFLSALALTSVLGAPQGYGGGAPASSTNPTPTSASSASSSAQTIMVASSGLSFTPNTLTVAQGDQVVFMWPNGGGHSVTQGYEDAPCSPLSALSGAPSGFNSGVITTANSAWVLTITNASTPIVFHCSVPGHCQAGMFGVINPTPSGAGSLAAASQALSASPVAGDMAYASVAAAAVSASGTPAVGNTPSSAGAASSSPSSSPNGANLNLHAGMALTAMAAVAFSAGAFILAV